MTTSEKKVKLERNYSLITNDIAELEHACMLLMPALDELKQEYYRNPSVVETTRWKNALDKMRQLQASLESTKGKLSLLLQEHQGEHFDRGEGIISFDDKSEKLLEKIAVIRSSLAGSRLTEKGPVISWGEHRKLDALILRAEHESQIFPDKKTYQYYLDQQRALSSSLQNTLHQALLQLRQTNGALSSETYGAIKKSEGALTNGITSFISLDILGRTSMEERVIAFSRWVHLAGALEEDGDLQSAFSVHNAFMYLSVERLKLYNHLTKETQQLYQHGKKMISLRYLGEVIRQREEKGQEVIYPFNIVSARFDRYEQENRQKIKALDKLRDELTILEEADELDVTAINLVLEKMDALESEVAHNKQKSAQLVLKFNTHCVKPEFEAEPPQGVQPIGRDFERMQVVKTLELDALSRSVLPRGESNGLDGVMLAKHPQLFSAKKPPQSLLSRAAAHPVRTLVAATAAFFLAKILLPFLAVVGAKALIAKLTVETVSAVGAAAVAATTVNDSSQSRSSTKQLFNSLAVEPERVGTGAQATEELSEAKPGSGMVEGVNVESPVELSVKAPDVTPQVQTPERQTLRT